MNAITVSHHFAEWNRARTEYSDPATPKERIAEMEAPDAPDVWGMPPLR